EGMTASAVGRHSLGAGDTDTFPPSGTEFHKRPAGKCRCALAQEVASGRGDCEARVKPRWGLVWWWGVTQGGAAVGPPRGGPPRDLPCTRELARRRRRTAPRVLPAKAPNLDEQGLRLLVSIPSFEGMTASAVGASNLF